MIRVTIINALLLWLFMAVSNFSYQFFQDAPNYSSALERSYFQAWALLLAWAWWRNDKK